MPRLRNSLLLLVFLSTAFSVVARPKIGLALSGGGAKGAAHLGVMQLLEEYNVPVDYVAGTSMGAYFGAMLAMGYTAEEIEALTFSIHWESGFVDDVTRSELSLRSKKQQDDYQISLPLGLNEQGIQIPKGAVQGQTMAEILRFATSNLEALASFDELAIPYRAVATDMAEMKPYILERGDLAVAMQASMSVPGALRPVELDGKQLSDGGVVNNMPVDVLKEMGADIIIAVDIGSRLKKQGQLNTAVDVVDQLSIFLTRSGTERQIALLSADDLLISPDMTGVDTADFSAMPLALQRGKEAGREPIAELAKRIGVIEQHQEYLAYRQTVTERKAQLKLHEEFVVNRIELNNDSSLSDEVILARLKLNQGELLSKAELEEKISQLYALGTFERVDYRISTEQGENVIHVDTQEKSWGPGYFDMKIGLQENFSDRTEANIGLGFTLTNLNDLGAEWRNEVEIGSIKRLYTEYYSPITESLKYSWAISAEYDKRNRRLYGISEDFEYLEASFSDLQFRTHLAWNYQPWQEWAVGLAAKHGNIKVNGIAAEANYWLYGPYFKFDYDTLNSWAFPTQGKMLDVNFTLYHEDVDEFSSVLAPSFETRWKVPFGWDKHNFNWFGEYGSTGSDFIIPTDAQDLGGFLRLSGFTYEQLSGRYKALTGLMYFYQLHHYQSPAFQAPVFVGGSLENGGVWNNSSDISYESAIWAGSVFMALDTSMLGPIVLAYGHNQTEQTLYLFIGNDF
ncbi:MULTISPECIES: patatin-like phospholipase family protein [unclassified Agarivorans]|uniref:patatin-like phospholipase family protein n=1 Tax=unclassified Agarivorans TaxID=2636026 RepID=UPI0026E3DBEF|nr:MULTISPECIES: patatin-like phospholipase family protein [unclassified Agarivorans]MDO6686935.1 patatin-like phospholipase family protein [Agarivorans sp. 3_MG-2023]MDO6716732.1 patatin-like phospholipase family protein [Agarivorans sp. 2_MG-2023]